MKENSICVGKTDCTSFAIFISVLVIVIFLKYLFKCSIIPSMSSQAHTLPLVTPTNSTQTHTPLSEHMPLSEHSPLYRRALKSIPLITYKPTSSRNAKNNNSNGDDDDENNKGFEDENCVICLGEFEKGEKVRIMPSCNHVYHMECIDRWLLRALHCPVCRKRVVIDQHHHPLILSSSNHQV